MVHLKSIKYVKPYPDKASGYPFNLQLIKNLDSIDFTNPVTILIGENGSGKSTLLEAAAFASDIITVSNKDDSLFEDGIKSFASCLKLIWTARTKRGFFLRAEDFLNYTIGLKRIRRDMAQELKNVDVEYSHNSDYAKKLARLPYQSSIYELDHMYEGDLNERSHGESFLKFFESRISSNGLYILDEPETPLSPMNQIALLTLIKEFVKQNSQFIIATHSPILMAYPEADIFSLDGEIKKIQYNDIESVKFLKAFLNMPEKYLRYL